jgi:hypothetical protein
VHKVEDIDTSLEDHAMDSLRYMCNMVPVKPQKPIDEKKKPYNPLDDDIIKKPYSYYIGG